MRSEAAQKPRGGDNSRPMIRKVAKDPEPRYVLDRVVLL